MNDVAHHEWFIEQREIDRQVSRRGRVHAYEHLDPRTTALVVVDIVPFFVEESAYVRGIVPTVNQLATRLRALGGTVAWVVPRTQDPTAATREFYGDRVAELYAGSGGEGSPRQRLWQDLDVAATDVVTDKPGPSAFFPGTCDLHDQLTARDITTLLVTGTVTNVCVESTVRDASALGYRVVLVADACAAVRDQDHNATLHVVYRSFGDVRSAADVLALLESGKV
ncbi:MAG: cysteine hydrolase family protein [Angustibacter sp.]